jgi:hydroxyacyl-ACP dehydratase HTD2-like protein with hotdog domain
MTVTGLPELAEPGRSIPELVREPTAVQLFEFSAATWNSHRIHYDRDYARDREGYPDILVQSHLHACFLSQAAISAFGPGARLERIGWRNRGVAVPGDRLTVTGEVEEVRRDGEEVRVALRLEERNQRGELCVQGWATIAISEVVHIAGA